VSGQPTPVITWKKDEENVMIGGRFRKENGNLHISVSYVAPKHPMGAAQKRKMAILRAKSHFA